MKEQILEYLQGERDFDLGLILLTKYANRKALSNLIESCKSKGESEYNRNKLDIELIKLIGVTYKVVAGQKMRNYEMDFGEIEIVSEDTDNGSGEKISKVASEDTDSGNERLLGSQDHSQRLGDLPKKK